MGVAMVGMSFDALHSVTRLGVLGGTFDPIHFGHLLLAEEARIQLALDAVLFIPAGEPPHKSSQQASVEQRFLMVSLATASHPQFHVSRLEIERLGISYTVDTLHALHTTFPQAALYLLLGADAAFDLPQWRAPEVICRLATVVAATRPGFSLDTLLRGPTATGICFTPLPIPGLFISSTALRQRVSEGYSLRYLTPDVVASYIAKEKLYCHG